MASLEKVFSAAVKLKASDVHFVSGEPVIVRKVNRLVKLRSASLTAQQVEAMIRELLNREQKERLAKDLQLDFALDIPDLGRFRGSVMRHYKGISAVFRVIPGRIPGLEELGLPDVARKVLDNHQGLILVTGATGQGKSTTLAAMIDHINATRAHHILTVEDPIEFKHPIKKAAVNQRQIGRDTLSYGNSLKAALREDPDVIMIGELRDLETISLAITAAETGHLVLGTLSTSSAAKTVDRIIDSFPATDQNQVRSMLSESLRAVVTQRLIPAVDKESMVLGTEILIGTLSLTNLIRDEKTFQINSMIQTGKAHGMRLMDESIMELLQSGRISREEALRNMNNPRLLQKGAS